MSDLIKTGGRTFNPADNFIYFLASNVSRMQDASKSHNYLLIAINELNSQHELDNLWSWFDKGKKVFIDSGIFNLTNVHKKKHNITMDQALALAPEEIDGFDKLFDKYVDLVGRLHDHCWGYIELDQGGRENKIRTRARLEAMGLRPIPVYHPFNDGWDYFDYLAERYDRICFGNVVQADRPTRLRLIATAWERHRKYPHLWIHLLGLTPNEWLYGFPINSGDSSAWLSAVKWSGYKPRVMGTGFGHMPRNYQYLLGSDGYSEVGSDKAARMSAYGARLSQMNWRNHLEHAQELGFEIYPEVST